MDTRETETRTPAEGGIVGEDELSRLGFPRELWADEGLRALVSTLRDLGTVLVAYSGGADSAFLLKVARMVLGDGARGALGVSESLDRNELDGARRTAEAMGIPIDLVETREYEDPAYRRNESDRCYHCKRELFGVLGRFAAERGIAHVVDGSNLDDSGDYRPGFRARNELRVRSPLLEAGIDKAAVRRLSKALGLPTWDKPAAPCLSSRIPYGEEVTQEKLRSVEAAESALRNQGFRVVRVRHHGAVARIEVPLEDLSRLLEVGTRARVLESVKSAGFRYVTLDIEGFRSGSLNEVLGPIVHLELPGTPR